jgi:hypothetical protein
MMFILINRPGSIVAPGDMTDPSMLDANHLLTVPKVVNKVSHTSRLPVRGPGENRKSPTVGYREWLARSRQLFGEGRRNRAVAGSKRGRNRLSVLGITSAWSPEDCRPNCGAFSPSHHSYHSTQRNCEPPLAGDVLLFFFIRQPTNDSYGGAVPRSTEDAGLRSDEFVGLAVTESFALRSSALFTSCERHRELPLSPSGHRPDTDAPPDVDPVRSSPFPKQADASR